MTLFRMLVSLGHCNRLNARHSQSLAMLAKILPMFCSFIS